MSAICGLLRLDGEPTDPARLKAAMRVMARYGPDGSGTWSEGAVALGHQMHRLVPESATEVQPHTLPEPGLTITAAARIDNREELAEAFGIDAAMAAEWPDARYILSAYERWGIDCVPRLLGDFAFALWDGRQRRLLLARDFAGIRPLYYAADDKRVSFASDVHGALEVAALPPHLDLRALREQLGYGSLHDNVRTFFEGLHKLPPGHWLVADASGVKTRRYWRPSDVPRVRVTSDRDAVEHILDLVNKAVRSCTRCSRPVGAHASGGLDSSTLAVLSARILGESGRSLTAINWAPPFGEDDLPLTDERALVEAIAAAEGNIDPCYTPLTADDLANDRCSDITLHPHSTLRWESRACPEAAARGVRVVLSGWGGDETIAFNGRGFFSDLARRGRWIRLARELRERSRLHPVEYWGLRGKVLIPLMPDWAVARWTPRRGARLKPLPSCLSPELTELIRDIEPPTKTGRERPGRRRMQETLLNNGHLNGRCESWNDYGANHGIEYRFPVLDRRVVEFALGAPDWLFFKNGWKRYAFRKAMEGLVPADAQWRKRKNDPAMIKHTGPLMEPAEVIHRQRLEARESAIRAAGLLNYDALVKDLDADEVEAEDRQAGAPPRRAGTQQAAWLAFATGTLP